MLYNLIKFRTISDNRGDLTELENIPFEIKRSFILSDVPITKSRGNHAHYETAEIVIPLTGIIYITLSTPHVMIKLDGKSDKQEGILIPPNIWRKLEFSKNASCLVLCSTKYDEKDYIRNWFDYVKNYKK